MASHSWMRAFCRLALSLAICGTATAEPRIFVARRGWHIDVGFAVEDLEPPLANVAHEFPDVRYVFFGFADRRYLTSAHHALPAMLAALWPGKPVLLVTGLAASPDAAFGESHIAELRLTPEQSAKAQTFVRQTLTTEPVAVGGPYVGSLYFGANGRYSAWHTCNTWAAEVLAAGGEPVRTHGVFAGPLWRQVLSLADPRINPLLSNPEASRALRPAASQ